MEAVAASLIDMVDKHGAAQQAAGEAGDGPLINWPTLVRVIASAIPDVPEGIITSDIGPGIAEWSAAMYHLGRARAEGVATFEDGRRVGAAEQEAKGHRQRWCMAVLAACAEQHQAGGVPETFRDLEPGEVAWMDQALRTVLDADRDFGRAAAVSAYIRACEEAPTAAAAVTLGEKLFTDHGIALEP